MLASPLQLDFLRDALARPPRELRRKSLGGGVPGRPAALGALRAVYSEAYEVRGSRLVDNAGVPAAPDSRIMMQFALLPPAERELYGDPATYLEAKRRALSLMRRAASYRIRGMTRPRAMRIAISRLRAEKQPKTP
jgi:hypothetical protein